MAHKAVRLEALQFGERFFPVSSNEPMPTWSPDLFDKLSKGGELLEAEIQDLFIKIVNEKNLVPGMKMAASSDRPDMEDIDEHRQKIDAAFFKDDCVPNDGRPHWVDQLISVEFKRHETDKDPFDDRDEHNLDAKAESRKEVRGQIITYAEVIFRVQHRTALYMLLVIGRNFRLIRWDRSGAIVTRAVDYVAKPEILCELLWRMSMQTEESLGVDPSATRLYPSDDDFRVMDEFAADQDDDLATEERTLRPDELDGDPLVFKYVRRSFCQSLLPSWPRYRLEVPHEGERRKFLVGRPMFHADGMAGRGTRGYVALDCKTRLFVWLKDAWRVHYELVDQEGAILAKLNETNVENIPTLVCHGDIRDQTTVTPDVWEEQHPAETVTKSSADMSILDPPFTLKSSALSSSDTLAAPPSSSSSRKRSRSEYESDDTLGFREDCPLRRHMHYRIVVREVAMPLSEFQSGEQLVYIVLNCVRAHFEAVDKVGILHRDVSGGNILIYPRVSYDDEKNAHELTWTGLLADWEMSRPVHYKDEIIRPRQPPRTGTWQFLSAGMLSDTPKPVEIPDELESYFHVLFYHALRYLRSNCDNVAEYIETFFDAHVYNRGVYTCGEAKLTTMKTGKLPDAQPRVALKFNSPLDRIFKKLLPLFRAHYVVQAYMAEQSQLRESAKAHKTGSSPPELHPHRKLDSWYDTVSSEWLEPEVAALPEPTELEEKYAKLLRSHRVFMGTLADALRGRGWRSDDKIGDQIPDNYKPKFDLAPTPGAAPDTGKRRKALTTFDYQSSHRSGPRKPRSLPPRRKPKMRQ